MAIKQDVNAPLLLTVGIVSALLLLVVVFGVQAWFVREENAEIEEKWKVAATQPSELQRLRDGQLAKIEPGMANARQLIIQNGGRLPATQPAAAAPK